MVSNAEDRFVSWAERALEFADELVVCVDSASQDGTLDLACDVADRVATFEHTDDNFHVMDWAAHLATGDWILWLDDDDLLHRDFPAQIEPLLADRSVTHYWQPYRWLVDDDGTLSWIRQFPWYPNPVLRLFRNLGGIFAHAGRHHSPFDVQGDGRLLDGDELALWHTVFLIRDQEALRAKVARYRGAGISCEEYYLLDDAGPLALEPAPAAALIRDPTPQARARAEARRSRKPTAERSGEVAHADAATLRRSYARHRVEADIYSADYVRHQTPERVAANQGASAQVTVRNTSDLAWRAHGLRRGRVALSYHWEHGEAGELVRQGDVSALPDNVEPGEEVTIAAGLWAPYEPGTYHLVWDLQTEDVCWFSQQGVQGLRVPVEVIAAHRRLACPRTVAQLPSATPAAAPWRQAGRGVARWAAAAIDTARSRSDLHAANVRPIPPERLYDSRNGTGVPGAVVGPLRAGDEVRLAVAGHRGIPDGAIGIVASVAVVEADYNGYITLRPAGTRATTVASHFAAGGPAPSTSVVVGLGAGPHTGMLSVVCSDNWPGQVQVLVEATAYLDGPRRR